MTWPEWNLKWCHEIDGAIERAHMALKETGIDWAELARFPGFSGCGHNHVSTGWDMNGPEIPLGAMKKAARVSWPAEMAEEWCQLMDEEPRALTYGHPFRN